MADDTNLRNTKSQLCSIVNRHSFGHSIRRLSHRLRLGAGAERCRRGAVSQTLTCLQNRDGTTQQHRRDFKGNFVQTSTLPPDNIRYAVWLYFRFTLSFRDVEELLAERGIDVTYETVRCWTLKFGPRLLAT